MIDHGRLYGRRAHFNSQSELTKGSFKRENKEHYSDLLKPRVHEKGEENGKGKMGQT